MDAPILVRELGKRFESLKTKRATWDTFWQDVANFVMPRKADITTKRTKPDTGQFPQLFDGTAIRANEILASGLVSLMSPAEARWFSFDAPAELKENDEAQQWFRACSEVAQQELATSNFYTEAHEMHLDRGCFGIAALFAQAGRVHPLNFTKFDVGSFCLAENEEGHVDTLYREFEMTYRQMLGEFGKDALTADMNARATDPKRMDETLKIIHAIYPRRPEEIDPRKLDALNKPFASVYFTQEKLHIFRESGFDEQPFAATRYLKWGGEVYGMSPAWIALPDARQLNFLEKQMDALAEIKAFPRMLIPDSLEGTVDMRAGGVTYFDPNNPNARPTEWATQGEYNVGKDRAEWKRKAINEAFHVDFFRMFADLQKQMTAREVIERSSEKLMQFSATATLLTTEFFNPMLQRVWGILLRGGMFPPPPTIFQELGFIPEPRLTYSSRIALAIKAMENQAFLRHVEVMQPLWQVQPELLDNYDFDEITRDVARNDGFPARWLKDMEKIEQLRQARAEAMQRQQEMEQAQMAASAAKDVGSIKPDSAVAGMMQQGILSAP
jgi:hypothetical protein